MTGTRPNSDPAEPLLPPRVDFPAITSAHLSSRPDTTAEGDEPRVHAADKEEWRTWVESWEDWYTKYERASRRLRRGMVEALREFPEGSFIPSGITMIGYDGKPPPLLAAA